SGFLSGGDADFPGVSSTSALIDTVTTFAVKHGKTIDKTIVAAFPKRMTSDPKYDQEHDPDYHIADVLKEMKPDKAKLLIQETGKGSARAGKQTQPLIRVAGGGLPGAK